MWGTLNKVVAVLFFLVLPKTSWSQDQVHSGTPKCEKRYVLSFQEDAPGFFIDKMNQKNGTAYELLLEVVRRLGCKSTEQVVSYLSVRENFARNKTDLYALTTQADDLDKFAEFVEMYRIPRTMVVSKKVATTKDTIESVLKNPKIVFGNVLGGRLFIQEGELKELTAKHRLREFPGPSGVFGALLEGRIQATFSSPAFTYFYLTREKKMDQFYSLPDTGGEFYRAGFYLSRTRLSQAEREKIRKIIQDMRDDGTLLEISKKYVNTEDLKYYKPLNQ